MRDILTPEQVAEYLQLTTDTIYRLIRSKELAATQIGRTYRIPREDVQEFLQAHSNRPAVREGLFRRFMAIADRHPDLDSDTVLDELEQLDQERKRARSRTA